MSQSQAKSKCTLGARVLHVGIETSKNVSLLRDSYPVVASIFLAPLGLGQEEVQLLISMKVPLTHVPVP